MRGGQILDRIIKTRAALDRFPWGREERDAMIQRIVVRLPPREWAEFRQHSLDIIPYLPDPKASMTSCQIYGIKVEVDPDAA